MKKGNKGGVKFNSFWNSPVSIIGNEWWIKFYISRKTKKQKNCKER